MLAGAAAFSSMRSGNVRGAADSIGAVGGIIMVLQLLANYSLTGVEVYAYYLNMSPPERRGVSLSGLGLVAFVFAASYLGCQALNDIVSAFAVGLRAVGGNPFGGLGTAASAGYLMLALPVLSFVALVGQLISFLLLLRGIAQAWGNESLARQVMSYIITFASVVGAMIVVLLLGFLIVGVAFLGSGGMPSQDAQNTAAAGGLLVLVSICLFAIAGLGLAIWYIIILFQVRGTVDSGLRRG